MAARGGGAADRELGHGEVDRGVANDGADEWGGEAALGARESAASDAALLSIIAKYPRCHHPIHHHRSRGGARARRGVQEGGSGGFIGT